MGPSHSTTPAAWYTNVAKDDSADAGGAIIAVPSSPEPDHCEQEPNYEHDLPADFLFQPIGYELAPTLSPQYRDDGFGELHSWYAQNQQRVPSEQLQIPQVQPVYMPYISLYAAPAHGNTQFPSLQRPKAQSRLHLCANLLPSSPEQLIPQRSPLQVSPPIQKWPTYNLKMDETARKKQEKLRQNDEAKRVKQTQRTETASSTQHGISPVPPFSHPQIYGKRKSRGEDSQAPSNLPRRLRTLIPGPEPEEPLPSYYPYSYSLRAANGENQFYNPPIGHGSYTGRLGLQLQVFAPAPPPCYHTPIPSPSHHHATSRVLRPLDRPPLHGPSPSEETQQPITDKYEAYKWPVWHFELRSGTRFDFAQSYIDDWLERTTFFPQKPKLHYHITTGFIKGGSRFSVLVLHNAANPFQWGPTAETTTSIAVYGRYAHVHEEMRWMTITPWRLAHFKTNPDFILKEKWDFDMPKANDRRFHRAYWLAANMLPLKGLLNHCIAHEKPHDAPEEAGIHEKFEIKKEDLQCTWSDGYTRKEECEKVWQKILDEIDGKEMKQLGSDHVTVGGTEQEYEVD